MDENSIKILKPEEVGVRVVDLSAYSAACDTNDIDYLVGLEVGKRNPIINLVKFAEDLPGDDDTPKVPGFDDGEGTGNILGVSDKTGDMKFFMDFEYARAYNVGYDFSSVPLEIGEKEQINFPFNYSGSISRTAYHDWRAHPSYYNGGLEGRLANYSPANSYTQMRNMMYYACRRRH